jgi:translation initiation factor IF-1
MVKEKPVEVEGEVVEALVGSKFRVKIDNTEHTVLAHISGRLRIHFIKLIPGDRVKLEMSPYDTTKGRITYRL